MRRKRFKIADFGGGVTGQPATSRDVCERCVNVQAERLGDSDWTWSERDNIYWRDGVVFCPHASDSTQGKWARVDISKGVPKVCPYETEHVVASEG